MGGWLHTLSLLQCLDAIMAVGPDDFMPNHHKYYHIIGPNHPVGGGVSMCRLMIGGDTTEVGPGGWDPQVLHV